MQKYFSERYRLITGTAILLFAFLSGCEKDFDAVIDVSYENYQVSFVGGMKDTVDLKNPPDSLLELRLGFRSGSQINKVYFDIYASDNSLLNTSPVEMHSIGNNIFANQFILKRNYPIGNYNVKFNVTGFNGVNKLVAIGYFFFNNGQDNVAPIISNAIIDPDTLVVTDTTFILTSVQAADNNGLNDIETVNFVVYRPDGSSNNTQVPMLDNGNLDENGDQTAGDGIFSRIIFVDQNNMKGTYRFQFQAHDRLGLLSNTIDYFVLIQ